MADNLLQHVGVLGMHWGIHKSSTPAHEDAVKSLRKKKVSEMSNAELKQLTARLQLEKNLKDLSKQDVSAGKKFISDMASNILQEQVKGFVASAVPKGAAILRTFLESKIPKKG